MGSLRSTTRWLRVPLLALALVGASGCGVVESVARQAAGTVLGGGSGGTPDPPTGKDAAGPLSIAADETAAGDVAEESSDGDASGTSIYKVVEPNGTVRFTSDLSSVPPEQRPKAQRLAMSRSKPAPGPRAGIALPKLPLPFAKQAPAAQPPAARARGDRHEVVVYTTSWCGWCKRTRAWLDARGVDYENKDVERDDGAAAEMRDLAGGDSGVPVVVIDGEVIRGFNESRMKTLLRI